MKLACVVLVLVSLGGCATAEHAGFRDVQTVAQARTGKRVAWRTGGQADRDVDQAIHQLLSRDLSADGAVQIALLNNRAIQATYEELGIAQADLVQAGLLANPTFDGAVRFSALPPAIPGFELSIGQNVLGLLFIPLRVSMAEQQFSQARLRVTHEVLRLAADTEAAFYDVAAASAAVRTRRDIAIAAETSAEIAQRQLEAGTNNSLDASMEIAMYRELRVSLSNAELEAAETRERLNRLMGLWGDDTRWTVQPTLPELPDQDISVENLESTAMAQRLDLASARQEVQVRTRAMELWRPWMMTNVSVGASAQREGGTIGLGPALGFDIPIFDWGQASRARLRAQVNQAEQMYAGLAVDIRSQVREASARLRYAHRTATYLRDQVVPLRERIADLSMQQYNRMYIGVFQLLRARQDTISAELSAIMALRDYWRARAELRFLVGGQLPMPRGQR